MQLCWNLDQYNFRRNEHSEGLFKRQTIPQKYPKIIKDSPEDK